MRFLLPEATAFSLHSSKTSVLVQKGIINLHAPFKGRICLIHNNQRFLNEAFMHLCKQLNVQLIIHLSALTGLKSFEQFYHCITFSDLSL